MLYRGVQCCSKVSSVVKGCTTLYMDEQCGIGVYSAVWGMYSAV